MELYDRRKRTPSKCVTHCKSRNIMNAARVDQVPLHFVHHRPSLLFIRGFSEAVQLFPGYRVSKSHNKVSQRSQPLCVHSKRSMSMARQGEVPASAKWSLWLVPRLLKLLPGYPWHSCISTRLLAADG